MPPSLNVEKKESQHGVIDHASKEPSVPRVRTDSADIPRCLLQSSGANSSSLLALSGAVSGSDWLSRSASFDDLGGLQQAYLRAGKRAFDIFFAGLALFLLAPVLLACAAAIKCENRGPVFFWQRRLGQGGRPFSIIKFRTMIPDAEAVLKQVFESQPGAREEWEKDRKLRNDPRITRLGRFLRRYSLDELPQFWNVLQGDMSVVGPRPIVHAEIPFYKQAFRAYCAVRPGITGLWQVSGRNDTGYGQRVALDCKYVVSASALLDVSIVFKTFHAVIRAAGAY